MDESNIVDVLLQQITNWMYEKKETKKHDKKQGTSERNLPMNVLYILGVYFSVQIVADRLCVKV